MAGTDNTKAISPYTLDYVLDAAPNASTTVAGKVELATVAEAETGTDTSRAVTPEGSHAAVLVWAEKYDVRRSGVVPNDTDDQTSGFQHAIDTVSAAGGGEVFWLGDVYATQLTMKTNVGLAGAGKGRSRLLHHTDREASEHLIVFAQNAVQCTLRKFAIHGLASSQTGEATAIYVDNASGNALTLAKHRIHDLHIEQVKGTALYLGLYARDTMVDLVDIYNCDLYGIHAVGSDYWISNVDIGGSGSHGWFSNGATSLQANNIKSWGSGRVTPGSDGHGFFVRNGANLIFTNAYSQESSGHGWSCWGQSGALKGLEIVGAEASNDNVAASTFAGFAFNNVSGAKVYGQVRAPKVSSGIPTTALTLASGCTGIYHVTYSDISSWPLLGDAIGTCQVNLGQTRATPSYSASYTPNPYTTNEVVMTLTGNITINAPGDHSTNHYVGARLKFILIQDSTGGHTITFNAEYRLRPGFSVDTTADTLTYVEFECVGSSWVMVAGETGIV